MPEHTITIEYGYPDGHLKLSDSGYSKVDLYTRINWVIDPNSNVASIDKIHKEKGSPVLFILGPSRDGQNWTGKVVFAPNKDYDYYINWTEKVSGLSRTYDPKIAVKPHPLTATAILIVATIIILPTVIFFRKAIINLFKKTK